MSHVVLLAAAFVCAVKAIRARRLLPAAIWLAGVSAFAAIELYRLGAQRVAVVELSVGAGLVTVLFVFAISIAGDDGLQKREVIPNWLAIALLVGFVLLLGAMVLPVDSLDATHAQAAFTQVFWHDRELDMLLQLVLIFTGVLCLLGLLADVKKPPKRKAPKATVPQAHIVPSLDGGAGTAEGEPNAVARPAAGENSSGELRV